MYQTLNLTVPGVPVSVNHYKTCIPDRRTGRPRYLVTDKAKAFKWAIAAIAAGRKMVDSKAYHVTVVVYLGFRQRGDADNFQKVIGDGLQDAGVFANDSRVKHYEIFVDRDRSNPRTEITIEPMKIQKEPKESTLDKVPTMRQGVQEQIRPIVSHGDGAQHESKWRAVARGQYRAAQGGSS